MIPAIFEVMFDEGLAIFAKIVLKESILPQQPDSRAPLPCEENETRRKELFYTEARLIMMIEYAAVSSGNPQLKNMGLSQMKIPPIFPFSWWSNPSVSPVTLLGN